MGRKAAKKKRGAAKNTVPKVAPLVDATVFGGSYSLQVPQGWMHPAEVLASGLDARPSEQFVSRRASSGPGFASLIVDVVPAHIRDLGSPSGKQRLCEFVNYHEEENDATFKAPVEVKSCHDSPFESVWLIEYKSVGKLEGRTTRTMAALLESPEADVILRLNNGDTENVCFPSIVGSLRRVPGAPPPQPHYPGGSGLPVPQTIELDFDELEAVAKDRDVDVEFLWMTAQAMCSSDAELTSMDVLLDGGRDDVLVAEEQEGQRIRGHGRHAHGLPRTTTRRSARGDRRARDDGRPVSIHVWSRRWRRAIRYRRDVSPVPSTEAIYLPAAALFAAEALGCDQKGRSQILGCDTQEAEGYLVEPDGTVSLLRRPR